MRAAQTEAALLGNAWNEATIATACHSLANDFKPMSDMRASAEYRLKATQNMLKRYFADLSGQPTSVLEVSA